MWHRRAVPVDLAGKKIIVTGGTPGSLGFETARTLADWGAAVVVTTRSNPEAALAAFAAVAGPARRGAIFTHALDLSLVDSVERFAAWYATEHGPRLDVLVNNAGVHLDLLSSWKEPRRTAEGIEVHFRTNHLGTAHLTQRLLPMLEKTGRESGDARIVNVVSHLHKRGRNAWLFEPMEPYESWAAYGVSKLALMHLTFELERRHAHANVHAYCLHPGAVFTRIGDRGFAEHPLLGAVRRFLAPLEAKLLLSPEQGAQTQLHCATSPGLAGGAYYYRCERANPSSEALDAAVSRRVYEDTQRWLSGLTS